MTDAQRQAWGEDVERALAEGRYTVLNPVVPDRPREPARNFRRGHHRPSRRGRRIAAAIEGTSESGVAR